MMKVVSLMVLVYLLALVQLQADIFGVDNRRSPVLGTLEHHLSQSVAVSVLNSIIHQKSDGFYTIETDNMSDFICRDERFANEPSIPYACTGFLVGPDLLVTAGHCSTNYKEIFHESDNYCEVYRWVFDYRVNSMGEVNTSHIPSENVYACKQIIYAVADEEAPMRDFALIQLDRPVSKRLPLTLALSENNVSQGDKVSMLGSPMGMPTKYTDHAQVIETNSEQLKILTDLDAFQGNSGSPVFNEAGEVIGVLVSGNPSIGTFFDQKAACHRYNYCDDQGKNCQSTPSSDQSGFLEHGSDVENLNRYRALLEDYL